MTFTGSGAGSAGPAFPKRFYATVAVCETDGGFVLTLDGKPALTPARQPLALPTRPLAEVLAGEWAAVAGTIDPRAMPLTRLANSVIDGVSRQSEAVRAEILRYVGSDLLFYRAAAPADLVGRQALAWDPVLAWARDSFGARFAVGEGVMFVDQPPDAAQRFAAALDAAAGDDPATPFRLGALHTMTTLTGSTLLACAVALERLDAAEAWAAAHVDEDFQMAQWGADAEATERRALRWREMDAAGQVVALLRP